MIYLDNCATTRVFDESAELMREYMLNNYVNSSAPYATALKNEQVYNECRTKIANTINASTKEIYFTSGGTESDNTAIFGALSRERNKILISATEHPAVYEAAMRAQKQGADIGIIPVDEQGVVVKSALQEMLDERCAVVSIMHVNNETGTINPIEELARITHKVAPECLFHSDGVQAHMRVKCDVKNSEIDMYSMSGHKIHAPKGIGALYVSKKARINPLMFGGGQQDAFRPGTVNLPSIVAYTSSAMVFNDEIISKIRQIKAIFQDELKNCSFNSSQCTTAPHILSVAYAGVQASTLQNALEEQGVIVGKGSACSSRNARISRVLESMKVPRKEAEGTVRIGIGAFNTVDEAYNACQIINNVSNRLMRFTRK